MGKKRKSDIRDLENERTLFQAFQQAASSVSSLYTLASQQRRKTQEAGAKEALERVAAWVFSQYAGSAVVPTADLLEFLRQEIQDCAGSDISDVQVAFPVPNAFSCGTISGDENMLGDQSGLRRGSSGLLTSPPKRTGSHPSLQQQQQLNMMNGVAQFGLQQQQHISDFFRGG